MMRAWFRLVFARELVTPRKANGYPRDDVNGRGFYDIGRISFNATPDGTRLGRRPYRVLIGWTGTVTTQTRLGITRAAWTLAGARRIACRAVADPRNREDVGRDVAAALMRGER